MPRDLKKMRERAAVAKRAQLKPLSHPPENKSEAERLEDEVTGFVARLRGACVSNLEIVRLCRQKYGYATNRVERILTKVLDAFRAEVEAGRQYSRSEQILRLKGDIRELSADLAAERNKQNSDASVKATLVRAKIAAEQTLAKIEGNLAPSEHVVSGNFSSVLQAVLVGMTPEQVEERVARGVERRRLAEERAKELEDVAAKQLPQ